MKLRIATRGSELALWQANYVADAIKTANADAEIELVPVTTKGDRILDQSLSKIGGKGLFVKEIEQAILDGRADIAVHSMKDVPMVVPEELPIVATPSRGSCADALCGARVDELKPGDIIGTSSLRRGGQIARLVPGIVIKPLRGNVQTRLAKLKSGEFKAIVLAEAGLSRLGLEHEIGQVLSVEQCLPSACQGILGIQVHQDDDKTRDVLRQVLHDEQVETVAAAERACIRELAGSCVTPIAAYAIGRGDELYLRARVVSPDGAKLASAEITGTTPDALGAACADLLRKDGADNILAAL